MGFTLLELLITVSIMLILLAITATAIKINNDSDRVRAASRTVQSYLLGARDRAIYAKEARGVRFLRDPTNPRTVTSLQLVEPTDPWSGQVAVLPFDTSTAWDSSTNPLRRVRLRNTDDIPNWQQLNSRGLLRTGLRIQIPANSRGTWYVIQALDLGGSNQDLILTTEIRNPNGTGLNLEQAQIELPPAVIPNTEPVQLPRGVVIDLDRCTGNTAVSLGGRLPAAWRDFNTPVAPFSFSYTNQMDLMFSPRGMITGPAAATGIIHFYITEQSAADLLLEAGYGANATTALDPPVPDKSLVTVFTRTGNVIASPVNTTDSDNNGRADDPFYYAERGEVAGK